ASVTYRINATSAMGSLALQRADATGALKKARELEGAAYMDVRIIDPEGGVHDVETFARALATKDPAPR
ncbi:MAG: hypothetical protein IT561_24060, partial [Alphaproteobacteria bacterium]|nr:hypothetical protein [Alphaproteobacteria bacterium]